MNANGPFSPCLGIMSHTIVCMVRGFIMGSMFRGKVQGFGDLIVKTWK